MMFENLQDKVLDWAENKGIIDNSTPLKQLEKTQEELDETKQALRNNENQDEVADGIGDMLVTIIILAELANLDAVECLRLAYGEIKERKGEMRDGLFVKEENL
jgi:NTP pyrophosphatase (non-canonical NTP hydrolase)